MLAASPVATAEAALPIVFEANQGQADSRVRFLARGAGYTLFVTATEVVLVDRRTGHPVRIRLRGGRERIAVVGLDPLPGRIHYIRGRDLAGWRTGVPTYARVAHREVYRGIDAIYRADGGSRIEQDFLVRPGADPAAVRLQFDGVRSVSVDSTGDLVLAAGRSELRLSRPVAYQEIAGARREVPAAWTTHGPREAALRLGSYDRSYPLVIDPVITWATYLGGSGTDQAFGVAVDSGGSSYVAGETASVDFPTTDGSDLTGGTDVFVTRRQPNGEALIYSVLIGGSGSDGVRAIALDPNGNVYVAGFTDSEGFSVGKDSR